MVYLLSADVLPIPVNERALIRLWPLEREEVTAILVEGFISAVGHASTAHFLSRLLNIPIPVNRIRVELSRGDTAVRFILAERLPEGKILTEKELEEIPYRFDLIERVE